jgi:hypothetical protein
MVATQIAKPFIKFNPLTSDQMNIEHATNFTVKDHQKIFLSDTNVSSIIPLSASHKITNIELRAPYWIAGSISTVLAFLFLFAQVHETKNRSRNTLGKNKFIILNNEDSDCETKIHIANHAALDEEDDPIENKPNKLNYLMQKLMFKNKYYQGKPLLYMLTQTFLFILGIIYICISFV